jgi:Putative Flp pilus-assembly TadE/G-like
MPSPQIRIEMKLLCMGNDASTTARERGQTIALMAVAMVSVLAMAALAIDLTTLYVAHGEIQRAADAAALAGAKAFVDSGVTTSPSNNALQTLAQTMAVDFATAVVSQNHVAGAPAQFINGTPRVNLTISTSGNPNAPGNPRITVSLQRTGLPLFFARIWGGSIASVSATAIAEAYNPAYSQANTGTFIPPAPKCVKPFLVPNNDPIQTGNPQFVIPSTGAINPAAGSFIGETITLTSACVGGGSGCNLAGGTSPPPPGPGKYLPMLLPDIHRYCPSGSPPGCSGSGSAGVFESSTECCDGTTFDYQQCGVSATTATWDPNNNPGGIKGPAQEGLQCLIHTNATGPFGSNPQQDTLNISFANNGPLQIQPGAYNQSRYNVAPGSVMGTSDSIITIPLFDASPSAWTPATHAVTIVGFLQLFVNYVPNGGGSGSKPDMNATILNVVGCGSSLTAGAAISGGGASAIPVRLIHN